MQSSLNFKGKTLLITGSTRGIGYSYAEYLAGLGANIIVNGVNEDSVQAAVHSLQKKDIQGNIVGIAKSVSQGEEIIEFALNNFPKIDAVINNAGIVRDAQFKNMTFEQWDEIYRVHLESAFRISKAIWPHFLENGGGRILMTGSTAGLVGNFGQSNYAAMKAGLIGLTKNLALEGKKYNIKVNIICPGAFTDMTKALMTPKLQAYLNPDRVSPIAAYLCHESCEDSGSIIETAAGWLAKIRYEYSEMAFDINKPFNIDDVQAIWGELSEFKTKVTHPEKISHATKAIYKLIEDSKED